MVPNAPSTNLPNRSRLTAPVASPAPSLPPGAAPGAPRAEGRAQPVTPDGDRAQVVGGLAASSLTLGVARPRPAPDQGLTWGGPTSTKELNFGHPPDAQGALYKLDPSGMAVWARNGKAITADQWANMPAFQQAAIGALIKETDRPAFTARMAQGDASKARREPPAADPAQAGPAPTGATPAAGSEAARRQMAELLRVAEAGSRGKRPDGFCYMHVWNFIAKVGYGKFPGVGIPDSHATYARQFSELVDKDPARYGLRKLPIDNPYDAPAGAIVVVGPGTPGTAHPTAGDIAVANGRGGFYNGGEMGYRGRGNFPPGNRHVLGIYVPA